MNRTIMVFVLLTGALVLTGCTAMTAGGQDIGLGPIRAHYEHHGDWWLGPGCFEKVTGYAYNTGNATVDPVVLNFNLVENGTGTIRDSRAVYIGSLAAGQSRSFVAELDGECVSEYSVDGIILP